MKPSDGPRFWSKVNKNGQCWLWTGSVNKRKNGLGYGAFQLCENGKSWAVRAHRFAYELTHGAIPDGSMVLHHCDTPTCVNPAHLFLGSDQDNSDDKVRKRRQPRGETHPMVKLSAQQVASIRAEYRPGRRQPVGSARALSKKYGVDRTLVHLIVNNKVWKD